MSMYGLGLESMDEFQSNDTRISLSAMFSRTKYSQAKNNHNDGIEIYHLQRSANKVIIVVLSEKLITEFL